MACCSGVSLQHTAYSRRSGRYLVSSEALRRRMNDDDIATSCDARRATQHNNTREQKQRMHACMHAGAQRDRHNHCESVRHARIGGLLRRQARIKRQAAGSAACRGVPVVVVLSVGDGGGWMRVVAPVRSPLCGTKRTHLGRARLAHGFGLGRRVLVAGSVDGLGEDVVERGEAAEDSGQHEVDHLEELAEVVLDRRA